MFQKIFLFNYSLDDPCLQKPCANMGICIEKCTDVADYFCNCTSEFTGKNCTEEVSFDLNVCFQTRPIAMLLYVLKGFCF